MTIIYIHDYSVSAQDFSNNTFIIHDHNYHNHNNTVMTISNNIHNISHHIDTNS